MLYSARPLLALALLSACSVYREALLDADATSESDAQAGSLAIDPSSGNPSRGGTTNHSSSGGGTKGVSTPDGGSAGKISAGAGSGGESTGSGGESTGSGGNPSSGGTGGGGSSGGGAASLAGSAGGGGAPPTTPGVDLLDDMEDGNFYLSPKPPRYGYWYVAGDGTAAAKLPSIEELVGTLAPVRDASTSAVHFSASGFKGWGASLGLSFTDQASKRVKYDAGNATGISFWVRGSVTGNAKLRVQFPLPGTDPLYELCGEAAQGDCLDHYATQVGVTADWQHVTIPFGSLHQAGWGAPVAAFDPTEMLGIEWSTGVVSLDIWLDDLALVRPE